MSSYCDRDDIEQEFGTDNVSKFADLDNDVDATKIAARIARAIVIASEKVDDVARVSSYTIPLANQAGNTPTTIEHLSATLAGIWLYEARGSMNFHPDTGRPGHQYLWKKEWVEEQLEKIRDRKIKIDAM